MFEVSEVLNLSLLESWDACDESRILLATGVAGSSATMSLPLEDQWDIYKKIGPQQKTNNSTTQDKYQQDSMQIEVKNRDFNT